LHVLRGEVGQRLDVQHVDGDVLALGFGGGASVAGGDEDLRDARILRDLPGQRVLATAAADDQYVHFSLPMGAGLRPARWINKALSTLQKQATRYEVAMEPVDAGRPGLRQAQLPVGNEH